MFVLVVSRSWLLVLVSFVGGSGEIGAQVAVSSSERFIGIVGWLCSITDNRVVVLVLVVVVVVIGGVICCC